MRYNRQKKTERNINAKKGIEMACAVRPMYTIYTFQKKPKALHAFMYSDDGEKPQLNAIAQSCRQYLYFDEFDQNLNSP